jgi:hypothetical protein
MRIRRGEVRLQQCRRRHALVQQRSAHRQASLRRERQSACGTDAVWRVAVRGQRAHGPRARTKGDPWRNFQCRCSMQSLCR